MILSVCLFLYRKFRPIPPRIYFCYNQSIHQIYHSLFVAIELSNLQAEYEVAVLSTSAEATKIIETELAVIPNRIKFIIINHPGYRSADFNVNWFVLLCRLRMHRPKAVVVTDFYDNVFRQLGIKTFWAYLPHGFVNRKFGDDPHLHDYDLVLLPGEKEQRELEERIGPLKNAVVAGYAKLDYFRYHPAQATGLFRETKPVVIYNPHFDPNVTSFFDQGRELLESLSASGKYNVIFMPHPDLARRVQPLLAELAKLPNIAIAERSKINLDYMAAADIYLTDVSSSVFEWLYFNKPVLFFNTKKIVWQHNRYYLSWVLGEVVETVPSMLEGIDQALKGPDNFHQQREDMFSKIFANQDKNISKLMAEIIWDRLRKPNA